MNKITRQATIERESDGAVTITVSSDAPVAAMGYANGKFQRIAQVLGHNEDEIDRTWIKDGLPLFDRHGGDQVGIIREPKTDGHKLGGVPEFGASQRAQDIAADVAALIRRNLSVDGEFADDDAKVEKIDEYGTPHVRVRKWTPLGASFVGIPADPSVGVNRERENTNMSTETKVEVVRDVDAEIKAAQQRAQDIASIYKLARKHGVEDSETEKFIADGKSLGEFKDVCLARMGDRIAQADKGINRVAAAAGPDPKFAERDLRGYSFFRALRQLSAGRPVDGLEGEASTELARQLGQEPKGFFVPTQILARRALNGLKRDLQIGGGGTASYLVQTDVMSANFIDLLRPRLVMGRLGVGMMGGLKGDLSIPKTTAGSTAYWVAEGVAITESQQTLGQVTASPNTVGAFSDITRKTILQSSIDVEQLVINDLVKQIAVAIDAKCFNGGGGAEPTGLASVSGLNAPTVTPGTPTYAQMLDFPSYIMTDNADVETMKWALTPEVWAKLAATEVSTGSGRFVLDWASKTALGYPYEVSMNVPANYAYFGDWSQAIICMWSGTDVNVDLSTGSSSGTVRIVALHDMDFIVRTGESFAAQAVTL